MPELCDREVGIVLRPWRDADAAALADAWLDPAITAHCGVPPDAGPERARTWIAGWSERTSWGVALDLVVADAETDDVLGEVGLWPFVAPPNNISVPDVFELGWWMGAAHRGRGRGGTAVSLVASWALAEIPAQKVVARIPRGHEPSEAVARHAGLVRRGAVLPSHALWVRSAASILS
ncbi:MAG: GNAT family N-acetyltransferase [Actinomycetota bacterium]|nr:GNAT family N-acetyltransferase [Actinomycetota bacterium]